MNNIKFNNFQNICRTCMFTSDLLFIQDNNLIDVLEFLTDSQYSKSDDLPQQLCVKCIRTMNEIKAFAFQCKQTHLILKNSLNNSKVLLKDKSPDINNLELVTKCMVKKEFDQIEIREGIQNEHTHLNLNNCPNSQINETINADNIKTNQFEFIEIKQEVICIINNEELTTKHLEKVELSQEILTGNELKNQEVTIPSTSELNKDKNSFKTITKTRLHQCNVCNQIFKNRNILWHHKKVHSNESQFECDVCMKGFQHSSHLIEHKRIHSGERPFNCDLCKKTFATKSHLVTHQVIHSGERRFKCNECMKSFKQSSHLIRHKILHSGERPYQCDVCQKAFAQKSNLITHKATHK